MSELTTRERMRRMYEHRPADRVPITDWTWESTQQRWRREGLPCGVDWISYFGLDLVAPLHMDTSPRFEPKIIEESDSYRIERDAWGVTKKNFTPVSTTPQNFDFEIKDRKSWQAAKARMTATRDRIPWDDLRAAYPRLRRAGAWITVAPWFGHDVVNARMCGTETILLAMTDDPDWVADMCNTGCELALNLLDLLWQDGYTFDELMWYDDMAYRNGMFFSKDMWRHILRPYQKRTIDWAHAHGIRCHLHCCGNITSLIGDLIELGLDALNPLEVKAGMDPLQIKHDFGDRLVLRGGFDARHWDKPIEVEQDIRRALPAMMEAGGYVFASDHSIPDTVSLGDYRSIVQVVKEVGRY